MKRVALKFSYDGSAFDGYARQPTGRTVEGDILQALRSKRVIDRGERTSFQSASRTDKWVSAAGNVISLDTDINREKLIRVLNTGLENICFYGYADVPDDFKPRHARQRYYRYFMPVDEVADIKSFTHALELFVGEHEFRTFSKTDERVDHTVLTLDDITVIKEGDIVLVDFKARYFLWQMIRRIISTASAAADGHVTEASVAEMLTGNAPYPRLKPATPDRLVLIDVSYDFEFVINDVDCIQFQKAKHDAGIRAKVMGQIHDVVKTS